MKSLKSALSNREPQTIQLAIAVGLALLFLAVSLYGHGRVPDLSDLSAYYLWKL